MKEVKIEIETIKKLQKETTLEIENSRKKSGVIDASITNKLQKMEDRISGAKDNIENIDKTVKKDAKTKNLLNKNVQDI